MENPTKRVICPDGKLGLFALVIYIPDPLGKFLDDLRRELVPDCVPHAHVSVLPPRLLAGNAEAAQDQASSLAAEFTPFEIEAGHVEMFNKTDVIYLGLAAGETELRRMHAAMSTKALAFPEPYEYHPHITLAQDIPHEAVSSRFERAQQLWEAYTGPRAFPAESVVFVQNRALNDWADLAHFPLGTAELIKKR